MKKFLALAAVAAFSVSLTAQTTEKKEEPVKAAFSLTASSYGTGYKSVNKDEDGSYAATRLRPQLSLSKGGLEAVMKLEYDAIFGGNAAGSSESIKLGSDSQNLEVAQAYLKNKVDAVSGLTLTAGIAPLDYPLVFGDNAPLFGASIEKGSVTANAYFVKSSDGVFAGSKYPASSQDSQTYILDLSIKAGEHTIRPAVFATKSNKNADSSIPGVKGIDKMVYLPALALNLAFGKFGIDTTFVYAGGSDKFAAAETKYSAYAFDFAPNYKPNDSVKITGFFTLISGDSDAADDKNGSFLEATMDGAGAGVNIWRLFIIEDGGAFTTNSDVANAGKYANSYGYLAAGLAFEGSFGNLGLKLQGAYVKASKVASGQKKDMGIEADINVSYLLTKGVKGFVEGAFLKTGKFYETLPGSTQNAQYVNAGLTYEI